MLLSSNRSQYISLIIACLDIQMRKPHSSPKGYLRDLDGYCCNNKKRALIFNYMNAELRILCYTLAVSKSARAREDVALRARAIDSQLIQDGHLVQEDSQ